LTVKDYSKTRPLRKDGAAWSRSTGCSKTSIRPSAKACGVLQSAAYSAIDEHLQKPHNAGSRREARFFNTLLGFQVLAAARNGPEYDRAPLSPGGLC
jgi:hypothetical protein